MFIKSYFYKETNSYDNNMIKINDVIAFYYYNSIGGNYDDTFGNTVTLDSSIDGVNKRWGGLCGCGLGGGNSAGN